MTELVTAPSLPYTFDQLAGGFATGHWSTGRDAPAYRPHEGAMNQSDSVSSSSSLDMLVENAPNAGGGPFNAEAHAVLSTLRLAVLNVLSTLDGVGKPIDLEKTLKLDKTLSWQLFKITAPDVLASGSSVPSRTSIEKFLKAAESRGVSFAQSQKVLDAYGAFETLIDTHAGDRVTFNTMISAAAGIDEEWLATDLQHRRNMFRGLSHAMGLRAKTRVQLAITADSNDGKNSSSVLMSGLVDLRVLRTFPFVRVFGAEIVTQKNSSGLTRVPLGDPVSGNGYLLTDFATGPLPRLRFTTRKTESGSFLEAGIENPIVGKLGSTSLMFAELMSNNPLNENETPYINGTVSRPTEVFLLDVLVKPGTSPGRKPRAEVYWGNHRLDAPANDVIQLAGNYEVEKLGKGPDALATPDVPNYPAMIRNATRSLDWNIDTFDALRIRVEFPMYQTNVRIRWDRI